MPGGLALPWVQFSQGHASSDTTRSMIYNDPSTRNVVFRTGPSTAYKYTVLGVDGVLSLQARPIFNGATPWDSANFDPYTKANISGATFSGGVAAATLIAYDGNNTTKLSINNYGDNYGFGIVTTPKVDPATPIRFNRADGTLVGSVSTSTYSTSYNTASDYRIKTNYVPMANASELVLNMRFYQGEYLEAPGVMRTYALAHELQALLPEAVTGEKDAVYDVLTPVFRNGYDPYNVQPSDVIGLEYPPKLQAVDYSKLVPTLGAALQDALKRIAFVEAKLAAT